MQYSNKHNKFPTKIRQTARNFRQKRLLVLTISIWPINSRHKFCTLDESSRTRNFADSKESPFLHPFSLHGHHCCQRPVQGVGLRVDAVRVPGRGGAMTDAARSAGRGVGCVGPVCVDGHALSSDHRRQMAHLSQPASQSVISRPPIIANHLPPLGPAAEPG